MLRLAYADSGSACKLARAAVLKRFIVAGSRANDFAAVTLT